MFIQLLLSHCSFLGCASLSRMREPSDTEIAKRIPIEYRLTQEESAFINNITHLEQEVQRTSTTSYYNPEERKIREAVSKELETYFSDPNTKSKIKMLKGKHQSYLNRFYNTQNDKEERNDLLSKIGLALGLLSPVAYSVGVALIGRGIKHYRNKRKLNY